MNTGPGRNMANDSHDHDEQAHVGAGLESLLHMERAIRFGLERNYSLAERELKLAESEQWGNPAFHDLRARLYAQRGRLTEAEISWKKALQLEPENETYHRGLARVRRDSSRASFLRWPVSVIAKLLLGALGIAAAIGTLAYVRQMSRAVVGLSARLAAAEVAQATQQTQIRADTLASSGRVMQELSDVEHSLGSDLTDLGAHLAAISSELAALQEQQDALLDEMARQQPPQPAIGLDGVALLATARGYRLVFDSGLFAEGVELEADAVDRLTQLAAELEALRGQFHIVVTGYTDSSECAACLSGPLHMLRSEVALRVFLDTSLLTEADLLIGLPVLSDQPFPEDTGQRDVRNRTVVIDLVPRDG